MNDKIKSIYIDCTWSRYIRPDDFIVAIGKTKSNSVYHVVEAKPKPIKNYTRIRWYLKVFNTDLVTALKRDEDQQLITLYWYPRKKKLNILKQSSDQKPDKTNII